MSYLSGLYTNGGEADIRAVVNVIINGSDAEPPRGHWVQILRINPSRPCCVNVTSGKWGEANEKKCKTCLGMGWYFDKVITRAKRSRLVGDDPSTAILRAHLHKVRYYFTHDTFMSDHQAEHSRVIEIKNNDDGSLPDPIEEIISYHVQVATPFTCDHGRIEYWALDCERLEISRA